MPIPHLTKSLTEKNLKVEVVEFSEEYKPELIIFCNKCKKLGFTLNEYCLSHYTTKIKISSEEIFNKLGKTFFEEEIDIFNFLDMEYVEPRDRNSVTISKI